MASAARSAHPNDCRDSAPGLGPLLGYLEKLPQHFDTYAWLWFLAGVGTSMWLPVILAVLCVCGVLGGILLRVRAFIYLGVGFLLLDLFSMIWYAAVDLEQTWVWYVSGIVLGVVVLALFAYLEKRRGHAKEGDGE